MMLVILLGQIDLSVPWVVAAGAHDGLRRRRLRHRRARCSRSRSASPAASLIGLVNGIGVAYLRIPSMIITLATNAVAQGLMVVYTGGFSPQDFASPPMRYLATGFAVPGRAERRPGLGADRRGDAVFLLTRTTFGRAVYGIGNRERAAYLSGIDTRRVVMIAFAISGGLARLRRRAARRLCLEGGAVDGRRLSAAGDRRGGARRHLDPRRPRLLSRHRRRRDPDHAAAVDPVGDADAGSRAGRSSTASSSSPCCCSTAANAPRGSTLSLREREKCNARECAPASPLAGRSCPRSGLIRGTASELAPSQSQPSPLHFGLAISMRSESLQSVRRVRGLWPPAPTRAGGTVIPPGCSAPWESLVRSSFGSCPPQMIGSTSRMQGKEASEQETKAQSFA